MGSRLCLIAQNGASGYTCCQITSSGPRLLCAASRIQFFTFGDTIPAANRSEGPQIIWLIVGSRLCLRPRKTVLLDISATIPSLLDHYFVQPLGFFTFSGTNPALKYLLCTECWSRFLTERYNTDRMLDPRASWTLRRLLHP